MSSAMYECSHFSTVLPAFDLLTPFFMLIYRYKMVHFGLTLRWRGLEWLICISLITDVFYMLVDYLYFLLLLSVYVLWSFWLFYFFLKHLYCHPGAPQTEHIRFLRA